MATIAAILGGIGVSAGVGAAPVGGLTLAGTAGVLGSGFTGASVATGAAVAGTSLATTALSIAQAVKKPKVPGISDVNRGETTALAAERKRLAIAAARNRNRQSEGAGPGRQPVGVSTVLGPGG